MLERLDSQLAAAGRAPAPPSRAPLRAARPHRRQGVQGGDFPCAGSVIEGACALRSWTDALFLCFVNQPGCKSLVVAPNGAAAAQRGSDPARCRGTQDEAQRQHNVSAAGVPGVAPTRPPAAAACRAGRVQCGARCHPQGRAAKPGERVRLASRVHAAGHRRAPPGEWRRQALPAPRAPARRAAWLRRCLAAALLRCVAPRPRPSAQPLVRGHAVPPRPLRSSRPSCMTVRSRSGCGRPAGLLACWPVLLMCWAAQGWQLSAAMRRVGRAS